MKRRATTVEECGGTCSNLRAPGYQHSLVQAQAAGKACSRCGEMIIAPICSPLTCPDWLEELGRCLGRHQHQPRNRTRALGDKLAPGANASCGRRQWNAVHRPTLLGTRRAPQDRP